MGFPAPESQEAIRRRAAAIKDVRARRATGPVVSATADLVVRLVVLLVGLAAIAWLFRATS